MKKMLFVLFASTMIAAPAAAADFNGPRLEGRIAYDRFNAEVSFTDGFDSASDKGKEEGLDFGAEAGFDAQLGTSLVVGAYVGIDKSSISNSLDLGDQDTLTTSFGRNLTAGGRVGFAFGTGGLVYVKGGYSNLQAKAKIDFADPAEDDIKDRSNDGGYHVGGGVEFALGTNFYGKLEYVYSDYGSTRFTSDGITSSAGLKRHQGVVGLGVRF